MRVRFSHAASDEVSAKQRRMTMQENEIPMSDKMVKLLGSEVGAAWELERCEDLILQASQWTKTIEDKMLFIMHLSRYSTNLTWASMLIVKEEKKILKRLKHEVGHKCKWKRHHEVETMLENLKRVGLQAEDLMIEIAESYKGK
jgi:hypothetical protein